MTSTFRLGLPTIAISAALSLCSMQSAASLSLLTNGDFELGTFAGWTVTDLAGGSGSWFIDTPGNPTPLSGLSTSASGGGAHGNFYAVTDQNGPGTHALSQAFTIGAGSSNVIFSFDMFTNDYDSGPICGTLDHTGAARQCVRVDLMTGIAGAFDTGGGVVSNFYLGKDAGTNPNPFTTYSFDITSLVAAGGTFQIRFAEVDNQLFFNNGVDNVSLTAGAAVPEPATLALLGLGLAGIAASRRRKSV